MCKNSLLQSFFFFFLLILAVPPIYCICRRVKYLKFKVYLILCIAVGIKLIAISNLLILYQQQIYKQLLCNRTDNMNGFLLIADVPI